MASDALITGAARSAPIHFPPMTQSESGTTQSNPANPLIDQRTGCGWLAGVSAAA
jgi:hypothetical protein